MLSCQLSYIFPQSWKEGNYTVAEFMSQKISGKEAWKLETQPSGELREFQVMISALRLSHLSS